MNNAEASTHLAFVVSSLLRGYKPQEDDSPEITTAARAVILAPPSAFEPAVAAGLRATAGLRRLPAGWTANALPVVTSEMKVARAFRSARNKRRALRSVPDAYAVPFLARLTARTAPVVEAAWREAGLPVPSIFDGPEVDFVVGLGIPQASVETERAWVDYTRRERHQAIVSGTVYVGVVPSWLVSVERRGLAVCDGLLTLAAKPVPAPRGFAGEVFSAVWVEKSRGYSVRTEEGFIARLGSETFHARTATAAVSGLRRRLGPVAPAKPVDEGAKLTRAVARCLRHRDVAVSLGDATGAGLSLPGIRDWMRRYFPSVDLHTGSVTVGAILDVLGSEAQGDRANLALAACLRAISYAAALAA